jgi:hypothetical protein
MMRVIPIPILKTKSSNFYEKLMVYNQTFCELGSDSKAFCVISHEAEIKSLQMNSLTLFYILRKVKFVLMQKI